MNGCIDTVEAVRRLVGDITDHEIVDYEIRFGDEDAPASMVAVPPAYRKRELAIKLLYTAFCNSELTAWVRSAAGGLIQLLGTEWKDAAFWREIIVGGLVRASAGEPWLRYDGEAVLVEAAAFQTWRERRLPAAECNDAPEVEPFRTDAPGRPSARHIICAEFERRVREGEITPKAGGLAAVAKSMMNWWAQKRIEYREPGPEVAQGTVENMLRQRWNAIIADARKSHQ